MYVIFTETPTGKKYISWSGTATNLKSTYRLAYAKRFKTEDEALNFFQGELYIQHLEGHVWTYRKVSYVQSVEIRDNREE